jgi:hypothetical protein
MVGGKGGGREGRLREVRERARALVEVVMEARREIGNEAVARVQRYESMMM